MLPALGRLGEPNVTGDNTTVTGNSAKPAGNLTTRTAKATHNFIKLHFHCFTFQHCFLKQCNHMSDVDLSLVPLPKRSSSKPDFDDDFDDLDDLDLNELEMNKTRSFSGARILD